MAIHIPPLHTIPCLEMIRDYNALRLEIKGSRKQVYNDVKAKYKLTGSKQKVLDQLYNLTTDKCGVFKMD